MEPFFYATNYWELHWLWPIIQKTKWPVLAEGDAKAFADFHNLKQVTLDEAKQNNPKLVTTLMHYGGHQGMIRHWKGTGGRVYLIQRAFDSALNINDEFWSMDMNLFDKYFVSSKFDYDLLYPKHGNKIVFSGSPRLNMAVKATKMPLKKIYDRVGASKFYVVTVISGLPIHPDDLTVHYLEQLPKMSPYKLVYKFHPGANHQWFTERYQHFYWIDDRNDPWDTYKLLAASSGVITPSSFMAIEATIMGKPVILDGDITQEEYQRQFNQKQWERLPREMSSTLHEPKFTAKQAEVRDTYIFDSGATGRIIEEILR